MKSHKTVSAALAAMITLMLVIALNSEKHDVTVDVQQALSQGGLGDVGVSQGDKNEVILAGTVSSDDDKARAQSIARSVAGTAVIFNEIGVQTDGDEIAEEFDSDLDAGIDKSLEAKLEAQGLNNSVKYDVSGGIVILRGDVSSRAEWSSAEKVAKGVPNVKQVVNELEIKRSAETSRQ